MNAHIILVAARLSEPNRPAYLHLRQAIAKSCAGATVHLEETATVATRLQSLAHETDEPCIVQPLHLIAAGEFHQVVTIVKTVSAPVYLGMPLFASPEDYSRVAEILAPDVNNFNGEAVLLIGHGTVHPAWTCYPAFAHILAQKSNKPLFWATLGGYPSRHTIIERINNSGCRTLLVIPLLLGAGAHLRRDIDGNDEGSWRTSLAAYHIDTVLHNQGLALLPGIAQCFIAHIKESKQKQPLHD